MTFLQLVQRLFSEASIDGTLPASVLGQSDMALRCVNWILTAYETIQNRHSNWFFLEDDFEFSTISGIGTYAKTSIGLDDLASYKISSNGNGLSGIRVYEEESDEYDLVYFPWDVFFRVYKFGSNRSMSGKPTVFSISPSYEMALWPEPDAVYTVNGRYYKQPETMEANADTPIIPTQYHMAIVWQALLSYAGFEESSSVFSYAESQLEDVIEKLELNQLPMIRYGRPLA